MPEMLEVGRLEEVLEHAVAPAFLLGSVAAFVALLLNRIEDLMGRMRVLLLGAPRDDAEAYPEHDVGDLKRRVALLHRAVFLALCAGISGTVLLVVGFLFAYLELEHAYGMGALFVVTLALLGAAMAMFAREIWMALRAYDQFG